MQQTVALAGAPIDDPRTITLDASFTGLAASIARHVAELPTARVRGAARH
jgi:hypothetical protein